MTVGNLFLLQEAGSLCLRRMIVVVALSKKQAAVVPWNVQFFTPLVDDAKDGLEPVPQPEFVAENDLSIRDFRSWAESAASEFASEIAPAFSCTSSLSRSRLASWYSRA